MRIAAATALAVCVAAACQAAPAPPRTVTFCSEGSPESFSPMLGSTGTTFDANRPVYNRLLQFRTGTTIPAPALAVSWDISPDALVYTLHLRRNVAWQSNEDFKPSHTLDADDVLFSFERQWKVANPFHTVSGGAYVYFGYMGMADVLDGIEKVDPLTVRFTLKHAYAPFLADLAMDFAAIQSKEYADTLARLGRPEQLDQRPIGTGPFQFVSYQADSSIRYQPFARYWGVRPKFDALVFAITPDAAARVAKLRAGECQVAAFPQAADLPSLRTDAKLQLLGGPALDIGYIAFNTTKKPLDDVRVRTALAMAIDRKAILAAVYQGTGMAARNLIPPSVSGFAAGVPDYRYDPAGAKKLLEAAGLKDGFATDLWAMPTPRPYDPDGRKLAGMVQADLAKIGVKASIATDSWDEYRRRALAGEPQIAELGWIGDNGDADNFLTPLAGCAVAQPGGSNIARWCDKTFDALIVKAAASPDMATRVRLYQQALAILHKQVPYLPIAHSMAFVAASRSVTGYRVDPLGLHDFAAIDLQH